MSLADIVAMVAMVAMVVAMALRVVAEAEVVSVAREMAAASQVRQERPTKSCHRWEQSVWKGDTYDTRSSRCA